MNVAQKPYNGYWAEIILHSKKPGIFERIDISEELTGEIIETDLWVQPGDYVGGFSGANEAIGTLVLRYEDRETMEREIEKIDELVKSVVAEK